MARRSARVQRSSRGTVGRRGPKLALADSAARTKLLEAIRGGSPLGQAAVYAGFSERSLYRTLARGDDADVRAEEGEAITDADDLLAREVFLAVKEARAQVAVRNVALLQRAAQGGYTVEETTRVYTDENGRQVRETTVKKAPVEWRAALAMLERSFPKDFSRAAQQFEVIQSFPDAAGTTGSGAAAGGPAPEVLAAVAARLVEHTAQAAEDDAVVDAELVDDDAAVGA